jgi:OHCU decarboxylase
MQVTLMALNNSSAVQQKSLEVINAMDFQEFVDAMATIIEHTPLAAATVWNNKPFQNLVTLWQAFCNFVQELQPEAQMGVIRCYADLDNKLSTHHSKHSIEERKIAGLPCLTAEEASDLSLLNSQYKIKFSFPFVICSRENNSQSILEAIKKTFNQQ